MTTGVFPNAKHRVEELAIFGGSPTFAEALHVGRPNIGKREALQRRIDDLLDRRWLTNDGPYVRELESRLESYLGVEHCVAMCNATIALEIAIRAVGLSGEVIVPSFTFVATAHALQWQEITPVFADVDPNTHNLDPQAVEAMITPRTTGVIGVHAWGRACDVDGLQNVADAHGLTLLFDAAHAFGCTHRGQMLANFGKAEVFSFHATKYINGFEGGAVTTNDGELANKMRLMRNFGFAGYDSVVYIGTNGKMPEISAAMIVTGLESMDEFVAANLRNYCEYAAELNGVSGVRLTRHPESEASNYQYVVLEVDEREYGVSRDMLWEILKAENVLARRYFHPGCHRMQPYASLFPHAGLLLPNTERLTARTLVLPTGTSVSTDDVLRVCSLISMVGESADDLRPRIPSVAHG